ncbi:MAG: rsfS [Herminiimonas sp.]|nr:rsfS [Herminiimonas sp.]
MDIKKLQALVIDALEDVKAQEIRVFDTVHLTSLFDRIAIASGTSNRQTKALAASVRDKVKAAGGHVTGIEGEDTGEWVLVDLGDMIVHIMQPAIRAYYRLEEIWGEKEVKLGAAKRVVKRNVGPSTEDEAPAKKPGRHLASSKAEPAEVAEKPARKTASKTAAKTPSRAAKGAGAGTARGAAAKGTAANGTAAKRTAAKGTAAKGPAAKRSTSAAPKTAAKKSAGTATKKTAAPAGKTIKVKPAKDSSAPAKKTIVRRTAAKTGA